MYLNRRQFLAAAGLAGVAASMGPQRSEAADANRDSPDRPPLKAAIIGHSGRGDYGHGMDICFTGVPGVEVVAVADPVEAGRAKAAGRSKAARQYDDYRQMLEKEKPDLVSVAPRWSDQHRDMALAAIAAGAHVFMEKPITVTPAEAADILAAADKAGRKVAVAHQMRMGPSVVHLHKVVQEGLIGDLLQMHAFGKMDARAGGEDLLVLGVHLFDLMRMFAGDPRSCTARVTDKGVDITKADARAVREQIGKVAGDEIFAQYAFDKGVNGTFTSKGRLKDQSGHWGLEIVGSKGSARILTDIWPQVFWKPITPWTKDGREQTWQPIEGDPGRVAGVDKSTTAANRRIVDDLILAAKENRDPVCSARNATAALEMVMAVYHAALGGTRVEFPLKDRSHPLE